MYYQSYNLNSYKYSGIQVNKNFLPSQSDINYKEYYNK